MKKMVLALSMALLLSAPAWAQMGGPGMMGEPGEQTQQWGWGPGMMGGYPGYGMGPGMGPGMMGGYGGPGMMGGYGMGPGMMGNMMGMMGGYGMGPGMMNAYNPQMQKFLDETTDLRRQIHMKQFDYMEALRNPKTTAETMQKLQKESRDLTVKLYEKMPLYPYGQ